MKHRKNTCKQVVTADGISVEFDCGVTTGLPVGEIEIVEGPEWLNELSGEERALVAVAVYQKWQYNRLQRKTEKLRKAGFRKEGCEYVRKHVA